MNLKHFLRELQRRHVIKAAISYVVFSWVLIQAVSILYPAIGWGQEAIRNTLIILIIGFPFWIVIAYIFDWTPSGFKKTQDLVDETSYGKSTNKRLNAIIIFGLTIAVLLLITDRIFNFTGNTQASIIDKSIAVLAFTDMSPNKDQEYFSDGISEEILNLLAKVPDLKVISRTSSFAYKGKNENIKQIGKELQVRHVLEGSIRKSGNTIRVTAQLIDTKDGTHVWSSNYDREMSDVFTIQDEIAGRVTQQLKTTLLDKITSTTADPKAYDLYLQARQVDRQGTEEANQNAKTLMLQSIAIDSTYAPAWSYFGGIIFDQIYVYATLEMTQENIVTGKNAAKRAIHLDPDFAFGYTTLSNFQRTDWEFTGANANVKRALALEPEHADVIKYAAIDAIWLGKPDEALRLLLRSKALDPLNYYLYHNLGFYYWMQKDYENAVSNMKVFLLHYPNASGAHGLMSMCYLDQGNYEMALEEIEKEPHPFWKLNHQSMLIYATGSRQEADDLIEKLIQDWGDVAWPNIASVYAYRKDRDNAFKWLNLAYENRDGSTLEILNYPEMENLWGDPRWNAFIDKLGLPKGHGFHRD